MNIQALVNNDLGAPNSFDIRSSARKPVIMVIDDDSASRLQVRCTLETSGVTVVDVASGEEAVACFQANRPDLVLLDVVMPGTDGFMTCQAIRGLAGGAHTPVVMITALEDAATITRAFDVGATDFIGKPINLPILGYRIRYWLRSGAVLNELKISQERLFKFQGIARLGHWQRNLDNGDFQLTCHTPEMLGLRQPCDYQSLFANIVGDDRGPAMKLIDDACQAGLPFRVEYRVTLGDGCERVILNQGEVVDSDRQRLAVGTVQDITEMKQAEERIHYLAFYDHLTGLANRSLLREYWLKSLPHAQRNGKMIAILFIDLDYFKRINDTLGHPSGDKALITVAERLKNILRHSDIIARTARAEATSLISRIGGDEFTIIATEITTPGQIAGLTERILEVLACPLQLENIQVSLSASIGISVYPEDGDDFDTLLKNADTAMYEAKERGRNNYQFFQHAMNDAARERFQLSNRLRQALVDGQFALYYQPQFTNNGGKFTGVEALVRWLDPEIGVVTPDRFLPFAEENGFIHHINDWVILEACTQARKWVAAGLFDGCRMGINISGNNINFERLGKKIIAVLAETGLSPQYLEVELTERVMMDNTGEAIRMLLELKRIGIAIAIDDFGTGYSALSHLQQFPLTTLKIDKSFVRNIATSDTSLNLLHSIIGIAKSFNLKVVAEGVETEDQLSALGKMDCDELQGFLLSRPIPREKLEELLLSPQRAMN